MGIVLSDSCKFKLLLTSISSHIWRRRSFWTFVFTKRYLHSSSKLLFVCSFCGTQTVEFVTYEDSVNIILKTSSSAVTGQGFVLSFKPVNGCGGELTGAAGDVMTIASPGYPRPYTKDVSCMWDLTVRILWESVPWRNCGRIVLVLQYSECHNFSVKGETFTLVNH